jgi:cytochrome c peroxidase
MTTQRNIDAFAETRSLLAKSALTLAVAILMAGPGYAGIDRNDNDRPRQHDGRDNGHENDRSPRFIPNMQRFTDQHGEFATFNLDGRIDTHGAFFQSLGTNGRSCASCHQADDGWTITPNHLKQRFEDSNGTDPVFRPVDGANCPTADVSSRAKRRQSYSLLLNRGLIRIGMPVPANAEFSVIGVDNPYGCNRTDELSMYRRPLPATSLVFLSTVMWDGRESVKGNTLIQNLEHQVLSAVSGHAQGTKDPTPQQVQEIVDFETQLFTAQVRDRNAGELDIRGAQGGAKNLSQTDFFLGINDPLGQNPSGKAFSPEIFDLFQRWSNDREHGAYERSAARQAIARGEQIFNSQPIAITGVAGLNDVPLQDGAIHPLINGFCGTCHDTPNVGHHSVPAPLNIGVTDASRRTADMPLITLMNTATGQTIQTTDPGRAMVTGKWSDVGKFKGPILRALPTRAPYFHNGMAASLDEVVDFYNTRFSLNLNANQKNDLVAFLKTL